MAKVAGAKKEVRETIVLTVSFEYELVDGNFKSTEDQAHYEKYVEYVEDKEGE